MEKTRFIADTHCDALMRMTDLGYSLNDDRLQAGVSKMTSGGHDLQIFACFIDPVVGKEKYVTRTLQMIDLLRMEVQAHRKKISLCNTMAEIRKARSQNKKIAMLAIEGGHAIANDLSILRCFRRLGVTYMTLTWSNTNDWADSSGDEERWGGLTQFGHEVVREMNRIGMMVDISHVSDRAFWHALRTSSKPVIASHSSVRALCNHPRNMTDEMMKATAEKGGVIFVNFFPAFIHQGFSEAYEKLRKRYQRRVQAAGVRLAHRPEMISYEEETILRASASSLPMVTINDVVRHVEYVANLIGVESVGFGSDYDGIPFAPEGLEDCTSFPLLCDSLRKRKFTSSDIDKIAGGNFLRVFAEVTG